MTVNIDIYPITYCAVCNKPLPEVVAANSHLLADKHIYKRGELAYIELAHKACAVKDGGYGWEWTT